MRFHSEEFFDMELYPIPKGVELFDGNLYYIDYGDGQPLRECYHRFSSEEFDMYQDYCSWEETVEYYKEQDRIFKESLPKAPKAPKFKKKFNEMFNL